jgi:hypothetical protein
VEAAQNGTTTEPKRLGLVYQSAVLVNRSCKGWYSLHLHAESTQDDRTLLTERSFKQRNGIPLKYMDMAIREVGKASCMYRNRPVHVRSTMLPITSTAALQDYCNRLHFQQQPVIDFGSSA